MTELYRVKLSFDAAHFLLNYDGPCKNMHGHTWRVEFYLRTPLQLDKSGIGIDFKVLKEKLKSILPDHTCLNDLPSFELERSSPSAELIIHYLFKRANGVLNGIVEKVVLWESESNGIQISRS